ncbi:MAG: terminase small subunit [Turicibacter sp.]|jgi:phage terminase small subunit
MKLTPKQQAFADYYIQTGNATESAIKAGYSQKTAKETGYENLTKPHLQQYIEKKQKELESSRMADMTEVREFWTEVMRDIDSEMKDRLKASEMIAKTSGAFLNKVEMQTTGEQTITVTITDDDDED